MTLYMKQHIFTIGDRFDVWDEAGENRWYVEQELFTWGKTLHIYDTQEREVAGIRRELFRFLPSYTISIGGDEVAQIEKQFTLFHQSYYVDGPDCTVEGDFFAHDYAIYCGERQIASIHRAWLTWGDCYSIEMEDERDELLVLAVVLTIDCVNAQANNS